MNFFIVEMPFSVEKMAFSLCDQHRSRMIYETCVILCNAYYSTGETNLIPDIYKKHYYNHPQCRFARKTIANFKLLRSYLKHLLRAYDSHGGRAWLREKQFYKLFVNSPPDLPEGSLTLPYLTFGNQSNLRLNKQYKALQSHYGQWYEDEQVWGVPDWQTAVKAYRTYYRLKKFKDGTIPIWKHNKKPDWYFPLEVAENLPTLELCLTT